MTAAFRAATPAAGESAWPGDTRPAYRAGTTFLYLPNAVIRTEAGNDLTTEALAPLTTE